MGIWNWRLQPFQGCTLLMGLYPREGCAHPGVSDGETLPGSWRLVTSLCSLPLDETLPGSFGLCRPWRGLNVCNPWVGAYADEASRPPWGIRDNTGRQPRRWLQTIAWRLQPFQGCTLLVGLYPREGCAHPGVSDGETLPGSWRLATSLCSLPLDETTPGY